MRANWWGLPGERVHTGCSAGSAAATSSAASRARATDHYGVPYALTEEFVAVYRMHPLIPDDYDLRDGRRRQLVRAPGVADLPGRARRRRAGHGGSLTDLFYSFGIAHPGAVTLHNYPAVHAAVRAADDGEPMDLAATDILRTGSCGVPRYNEFRRLLHLRRRATLRGADRRPRDRRASSADLRTGRHRGRRPDGRACSRERLPRGFGFSDTAFRIFVLMASRRLKSDRFFTTDFTPAVYTPEGLDWIADNTCDGPAAALPASCGRRCGHAERVQPLAALRLSSTPDRSGVPAPGFAVRHIRVAGLSRRSPRRSAPRAAPGSWRCRSSASSAYIRQPGPVGVPQRSVGRQAVPRVVPQHVGEGELRVGVEPLRREPEPGHRHVRRELAPATSRSRPRSASGAGRSAPAP